MITSYMEDVDFSNKRRTYSGKFIIMLAIKMIYLAVD